MGIDKAAEGARPSKKHWLGYNSRRKTLDVLTINLGCLKGSLHKNSKRTTIMKQQIISTYKILQINVEQSKAAHDLLEAAAAKEGITIILISEPDVNITKQNDKWKTDIKIDTAIKIRDNIACVRQGRGKGFVYVE
ncbi:hypothetical protein HHI36_001937, partial [Cryptolaemus montrouzieri]